MSKNSLWAELLVVSILTTVPALANAQTSSTSGQQALTRATFRDVAKKVAPAVVNVKIKSGISFGKRGDTITIPPGLGLSDDMRKQLERLYEQEAPNVTPEEQEELKYAKQGSGVVVRADGYIVTSNHVVSGSHAKDIEISFPDGKKLDVAKIVGTDPLTDVAVLKVDAQSLPALAWGDSDKMQVGDFVMAVGNPLEFTNTVSEGIISALHRTIGKAVIEDLIQTTAMINPGNSGGALVNLDGELIGINMAIASSTGMWSGLGFAVASKTARTVVDQMISKGKVSRGYLGIEMGPLTLSIAQHLGWDKDYGVLVMNVRKDSAAEKAGLQRYDIIAQVDGKQVKDMVEVNRAVASHASGEKVQLTVFRQENGKLKEKTIDASLGERPSDEELAKLEKGDQQTKSGGEQDQSGTLGLQITPAPDGKGLLVEGVAPNSRAAAAGIQKGDRILQINRQDVSSADDVRKALAQSEQTQMFFIERAGQPMVLIISGQ